MIYEVRVWARVQGLKNYCPGMTKGTLIKKFVFQKDV